MTIILLFALLAIGGTSADQINPLTAEKPISTENGSFFVSIRFKNRPLCGGALITRNHVLTTGHCVPHEQEQPLPGLSVVIATDLQKEDATREVSRVLVPPSDKRESTKDADIAILVLLESIPPNENVAPIPLPVQNIPGAGLFKSPPSLSATLIGLQTATTALLSEPLKQLQVSVKRCKSSIRLCGKTSANALSSADEGSPLVYNGKIIGISLYRRAENGKRGLFANVYKYRRFISKVIDDPKEGDV